ncbi:MAG: fibrillarin-like rRNA/tRNA 2'-O-methyltransferase [Candidatus Aenigmatarchaeota archaeon]
MEEKFDSVYEEDGRFYTRNLRQGQKVYGEKLVGRDGDEYREWVPDRSKLSAALKNDLENFPIKPGDKVLYLGAGQGTTASHVSDIVGSKGMVYLVEFSERAVRDLLKTCEQRENTAPILADARKPDEYPWVENVDVLYEDVAQPDQVNILKRNADRFLKKGGHFVLAVKSRAMDVTKDPEDIYSEVEENLEEKFEVMESVVLDPWEEDHCLFVGRKV